MYQQAPEARVRVQIITPEDARHLLANNTLNRNINDRTVSTIARDMKNGDWVLNGESIKISDTGRLLDGQHRLSACVRAGVPFETLVISGLPESAMDTVDAGRKRTAGDVLKMHGFINNNSLAAAAKTIMDYKQHGIREVRTTATAYSNSEVLAFVEANPDVRVCTQKALQLHKATGGLMAPATGALIYYMFMQVDEAAAARFFSMLQTGADLDEFSPILKLRNYLIGIRASKINRTTASYRTIILAMKCWNKWRTNQPVVNLSFRENEQIPELI